jgi:ABC-type oligopeptide transport system substrate-binding subunit
VPQALIENYTTTGQCGGTWSTWTNYLTDNGPFGANLYLPQHSPTGLGSLIFERNERFWGKKPLLRRIEYSFHANTSSAWIDFIHGVGDSAIPPIDLSSRNAAPIVAAHELPGVVLQRAPSLAFSYLAINWNSAPCDDVRVRQAFSLALDRQAIAHEIHLDTGQPTIHLVP